MREPALYYRNNVGGTLSLLDAMRQGGVGRLVFSSTAAVYGVPRRVPITEDDPLAPINPYGRSKLAMEWALAPITPRPTGSASSRCATSTRPAPAWTGPSGRTTTPRLT
ncbi:MAG: NAD-dependent epimerase/dehydratase family protein [Pirellulales bacterium]